MTCIAGVDPGVSPTLAFWWTASNRLIIADAAATSGKSKTGRTRPIPELIRAAIEEHQPELVVLEDVHGRPGEGVASVDGMARAVGLVHGICCGLGVTCRLVPPASWKLAMGLRGLDKDGSRRVACELWPQQAELFRRKSDHNRAEAALLARYGLRLLPGIVSDLEAAA